MATVAGTGAPSVTRQIGRGISFFVGGVAALLTVLLLAASGRGRDSDFAASPAQHAVGTAVIVVLLAGGFLTFRSLRRWAGRPRWLVPAASLLTVAALVPALWAAAPANLDSDACVPLLSAWQPVVATPPAADLSVYESSFGNLNSIDLHDKAAVDAVTARDKAIRATPASRRVATYAHWANSDAACAPVSRTHLAWSAMALGVGVAAIAASLRRRRRA